MKWLIGIYFLLAVCLVSSVYNLLTDPSQFQRTVSVQCWNGGRVYSANGVYDIREKTFMESGTHDTIYIEHLPCLIRENSNDNEGANRKINAAKPI